jgi:hypothetical protein
MGDNDRRHITQQPERVAERVAVGRWAVAECSPTSRQILRAGFGDSVAAASQALASLGTPAPTDISTSGGLPDRTEGRRPDPNPAWRSDPRWISELRGLDAEFQANGALLPADAQIEAGKRLGLQPSSVQARFKSHLRDEAAAYSGFWLSRDEIVGACELPTVSQAYENGWADIVPFVVFWEALATRLDDPVMGAQVDDLLNRSVGRA